MLLLLLPPSLLLLLLLLQANDRFGEVVLHCYQPGDMVWVQDYHLMLLPSILKNAVPRIKVRGETLHCSWHFHVTFHVHDMPHASSQQLGPATMPV
jgi:hypothetical protein